MGERLGLQKSSFVIFSIETLRLINTNILKPTYAHTHAWVIDINFSGVSEGGKGRGHWMGKEKREKEGGKAGGWVKGEIVIMENMRLLRLEGR